MWLRIFVIVPHEICIKHHDPKSTFSLFDGVVAACRKFLIKSLSKLPLDFMTKQKSRERNYTNFPTLKKEKFVLTQCLNDFSQSGRVERKFKREKGRERYRKISINSSTVVLPSRIPAFAEKPNSKLKPIAIIPTSDKKLYIYFSSWLAKWVLKF